MLNERENISVLENDKKRVNFNLQKNKIQFMHVWAFAYREARKSEWVRIAADRFRFQLRIKKFGDMLNEIEFFSPRE